MVSKWGQNQSKVIEAIKRTQNKTLQILNFKGLQESVDYLHKESKIEKLKNFMIKLIVSLFMIN